LLKVRGQWQEAAGLLRDALPEQLEAGVPDPGLIGDLSYSLTMMGEHAEAHDVLRRALRIRERVYLIHRLTWLLSNCPDPALRAPEEALALAERANELEPDVEVLMEALAAALYRSGRYEEALGVLYAISDLHRSELRVPAACYRAMALFRLGDRELAREALREARLRPEKYGYDDYGSVMRRTTRVLREEAQALIEGS
jgi:tetratricopeptide (TPR) repeat protein